MRVHLIVSVALLLALLGRGSALLLLVHHESSVALFLVPLETGEIRLLKLIIGLALLVSSNTFEPK